MNEQSAQTFTSALSVVGMAAVWMCVFNRLVFPTRHTAYHLSSQMTGFVQAVYIVAFALAALVVAFTLKESKRPLMQQKQLIATLGVLGSIGVLLPVPFEDGTGMAIAAVVVGALLVATFITSHFLFWSVQSSAASARQACLTLVASLACFFLLDLVLSLSGTHTIGIVAACPLVSTAAALLVPAARNSYAPEVELIQHAQEAPALTPTASADASAPKSTAVPSPEPSASTAQQHDPLAHFSEQFGLSRRETELVHHAYRNHSARKISQELFIAESTVYTHLKRIYRKAGVHSRQELIDLIDAHDEVA